MSRIDLIAELSDLCARQAEIIKAQAYALEQVGAQAAEEEALAERSRLADLIGDWDT